MGQCLSQEYSLEAAAHWCQVENMLRWWVHYRVVWCLPQESLLEAAEQHLRIVQSFSQLLGREGADSLDLC